LPETVLSFSGTPSVPQFPLFPAVKSSLNVSAIAFDGTRNQLIAAAVLKNNTTAVVGLNAADLSVIWTVATTSPATVLAVSDDGSMLYAGLFFESAIQQIDLAAHSTVRTFAVADPNSARGAFDIAVRPGAPDTVAVAIGTFFLIPISELPTLFVQGVAQPTTGQPLDGVSSRVAFLDPFNLITFDNETTAHGLEKFAVTDSGLAHVSSSTGTCCGTYVRVANGKIFLSSGTFVDPGTLKPVKTVGSHFQDSMIFLPGTNSVVGFFPSDSGTATSALVAIEEFDADRGFLKRRFKVDGSTPGTAPGVVMQMIDAVATGPSSFAVLLADDQTGFTALLSFDLSAVPALQQRTLTAQSATAENVNAMSISLPFFSYAYDPTADRIAASVQALMGPQGSSLAVIKPSDGTVERFIPLSSDPREVFVSPTGSIAYVNLPWENAVQQVDLTTGALGPVIQPSPLSIAFKPDDPNTIAMARGFAVAIYQNGVQTDSSGAFPGGSMPFTSKVVFNGPGEILGFDLYSTGASIQHFSYGPSGLKPVSTKPNVLDPFSGVSVGFGYAYGPYSLFDIASDSKVGTFAPGSTEFFFFGGTLLTSPVTGIGIGGVDGDMVFERLTQTVKSNGSLQFSGQSRIRVTDPRSAGGGGAPLISAGPSRFAMGLTRFDGGDGVIYVISNP